MLQSALDLTIPLPDSNSEALSQEAALAVPAWAAVALSAMEEHDMALEANAPLTRGEAACLLYQAVKLSIPSEGEI